MPDLVLDSAPDLRRILVRAPLRRGSGADAVPDVRLVRRDARVDPNHLAAYAALCGFVLGDAAPVTYPHLLVSPLQMALMSRPDFPLPMVGLVHLVNTIYQARPVTSQESLTLAVQAANLRAHAKGRQVDLVSSIEVAGEQVWSSTSTYLSRGDHPATRVPAGEQPMADTSALAGSPGGTVWRLPADTGRRYAAVSGDWNPIHLHALTARPLGFPTAIAHGMYTYSRAMADLSPRVATRGVTSTVWFAKPVRLPATVRQRSVIEPGRTRTLLSDRTGTIEHAVIESRWERG